MQETHFSQNIENNLIQDFKGSLYHSNGISNSRGVAIWIKKNVEFKLIDEYKDNEGRLLRFLLRQESCFRFIFPVPGKLGFSFVFLSPYINTIV
jgi:exonuclease III